MKIGIVRFGLNPSPVKRNPAGAKTQEAAVAVKKLFFPKKTVSLCSLF
jgi:hypothetical protein